MGEREPSEVAREIVDDVTYMTIATADADGRPWASPVWFAQDGYREFIWISRPDARHSENIAARPEVSIVIFDSRVPIDTGQGVYIEATAEQLTADAEIERAMATFSERSVAQGGGEYGAADVGSAAPFRVYRATVERAYLGINDRRAEVDLS
jgi:nitroimidazol reductase NimA-like FMN-containing flavoprotein (pyridoxamine 5'-phosphate oxidase superfamily)